MAVASYIGIIKRFETAPPEVRDYFEHVPSLVTEYSYDVCIAYMFSRVERAQNMALYCGVVKLHSANTSIARNVIERQHITRKSFLGLFNTIYGEELSSTVAQHLRFAEGIRDQVVHGKPVKQPPFRKAIVEILEYAELFNEFVSARAGFRPFDNLRGFKGRGKPIEASTTRWLLKGMGFDVA